MEITTVAEEELETLQAIFADDIQVRTPLSYTITLRSEEDTKAAAKLKFTLPVNYPEKGPSVGITALDGITARGMVSMKQVVSDAIVESVGAPMIFAITSLTQEWLNEDHSALEEDTTADTDSEEEDDEDWQWEDFESELEENLPAGWALAPRGPVDTGSDSMRERKIKREGKNKAKLVAKKYTCDANPEDLRAPVICVLGHVDTGKTTLLDCLRASSVQDGEEGGITQQIGATLIPKKAVASRIAQLNEYTNFQVKLPGLVFIDTPGHESFSNMRVRGSSLCDFAVLTIEIMNGLQGQSIESIKLLRKGKTKFVIGLNKVDRIGGWVAYPNMGFRSAYEKQSEEVKDRFKERLKIVRRELSDHGVNATVYWRCKDLDVQTAIVPMSAFDGCGVSDLVLFTILVCQNLLHKILLKKEELQCNVLEVHTSRGLGTTCDVLLVNGTLKIGDKIMLCSLNGPVQTTIRSLIVSPEMTEMKGKTEKTAASAHTKVATAVQGLKIWAKNLDQIVSGSQLYVVKKKDNVQTLGKIVMRQLDSLKTRVQIGKTGGLRVQASTLGSLEALLEFLNLNGVPIGSIGLGPINPRDVSAVKYDKRGVGNVILAFDVKVTRQAANEALTKGVEIISSGVIYQLLDQFQERKKRFLRVARETGAQPPCVLTVNPQFILKEYDPLIIGMQLSIGSLSIGTRLYLVDGAFVGEVESIRAADTGTAVTVAQTIGVTYILQLGTWDSGRRFVYGRDIFEDDRFYTKINYAQFREMKINMQSRKRALVQKYCNFLGFQERDREDTARDQARRAARR